MTLKRIALTTAGKLDALNSASKLRNYLVKNYAARPQSNLPGMTNPYADHLSLDCVFPNKTARNKAAKEFAEAGWKAEKSSGTKPVTRLINPADPKVYFSVGDDTWATCTGPKKAKPSTIPYYD